MKELLKRKNWENIESVSLNDLEIGKELNIVIDKQKCLLEMSSSSERQEMWTLKSKNEFSSFKIGSVTALVGRLMKRGKVAITPIPGYKGELSGVIILVSKETEDN
jgi:hypothetical protein